MEVKTAYVIGSGPNGLTAAIILARAGFHTTVLEAQPSIGGGARSAELTLPGFIHDICSAVHPLAVSSPAFRSFPLREHGLEWAHPEIPVAHPLEGGEAGVLYRSIDATAARLGLDAAAYDRTFRPLAARWDDLVEDTLAPILHFPHHPFLLARFGLLAPWPATAVARSLFRTEQARALFAGLAAHAIFPLEKPVSAAFGLMLGISAHAAGWPVAKGGSQAIADALASFFRTLGGTIATDAEVRSLSELRPASVVMCDVTPRQLLQIAGERMPAQFNRKLESYRYGPGVFKMDWALSGPIPWTNPDCARAGTLHLGGSLDEIAASERAPWNGAHSPSPFVLLSQPSLFDPSRAPAGKHTAWAYCHVPNGSREDMSESIETQVERFAPGFRSRILARSKMGTVDLERHNANLVGGDINGGAQDLPQMFLRPSGSTYRTPLRGVYICSSSTPPGGGVHGMCGYHAAKMALSDFGRRAYN